jgi:hypothetical protein
MRLPITKARINLGALVKRAHLGKEYFIIEKDGIPIAGLMDIDEFEDYLELKDPAIRRHIQRSYEQYRAGKSRPANLLLAELQQGKGRKTKPARRAGWRQLFKFAQRRTSIGSCAVCIGITAISLVDTPKRSKPSKQTR